MAVPDKAILVDGQFVSERVHQVIQSIQNYCSELEVQWIPPAARKADEAAFRILHFPPGGEPYVVMHVQSEEEFDARVLKRIIAGDQRNGELKYSEVEAAEKAAKMLAAQRMADQRDEAIDMMYHAFRTPLNTYRFSKDLVIKDGIPFNAAKRKDR